MNDIELNEHWLVQKSMNVAKGIVLSGSPELVKLFSNTLSTILEHAMTVVDGKILSRKN